MTEIIPNVGSDPINPAYYAGTACAEIIEHMPTNVGFAAKYAWRLGEKDSAIQEIDKAIWYLNRQLDLFRYEPKQMGYYYSYAIERVNDAQKAGKLDQWRSLYLKYLISYTANGDRNGIISAILCLQNNRSMYENNQ